MKTFVITTAALSTLFALTGQAHAAPQAAPFEPTYAERINDFPWESAYFPASGPLQVKLGAVAYQDVQIDMTGDAEYDWDVDTFGVEGHDQGGAFLNVIGAEVSVTVAFSIAGFSGEVEIGVYDISENFTKDFTPYVLEGAAERPVEAAFEIGPFNLVDTPFNIGTGSGNFTMDFRIDSPGVTFEGTRVDLRTDDVSTGPEASIMAQGEDVMLGMPGNPGESVEVYGTEHGLLNSEVSMHLMPTVSVSMFGLDFMVGPFDIELEYPVIEGQPVQFDDYLMEFDIPEAPVEPSDDDGGDTDDGGEPADDGGTDDDGGEDDGDEPDDDGGDTDDGSDDAPMTDTDSAGQVDMLGDDGCGCSADRRAPNPMALGLIVLGLLGLRRRK